MGATASKNLSKVDIEVYFWYKRGKEIGHVAMFVPENCLYISFWPKYRVKVLTSMTPVPSTTHSYDEDISENVGEGRNPDEELKTTINLDLSAMEKEWDNFKKQDYVLLKRNCSDAIARVLEAGNDDFMMLTEAIPRDRSPQPNWTHKDWCIYIRFKLFEFRTKGLFS